jgi:hypothetical protein
MAAVLHALVAALAGFGAACSEELCARGAVMG